MILLTSSLVSCATLALPQKLKVDSRTLPLSQASHIEFLEVSDSHSSIYQYGKTFTPQKLNAVILQVDLDLITDTSMSGEGPDLSTLELIVKTGPKTFAFVPWTRPFDVSAGLPDLKSKPVAKAQSTETVYFIHDVLQAPQALATSRTSFSLLISPASPSYSDLQAFLTKSKNTAAALVMARVLPYAQVKEFMNTNGIDLNAADKRGMTPLLSAILNHNDDVVDGLIRDGADVHWKVQYQFSPAEPIHFAALAGNKHALDALMAAGVDLHSGSDTMDEPAAFVVRNNSPQGVALLQSYGIDFSQVKLRMAWSHAITALKFAQDREMTEVVRLLQKP